MFSLEGYNALVTGASGGIGCAIAKLLAQQGANLAISGTRLDALEKCAEEINRINSAIQLVILPCDLQEHAQVEELVPQVEEKLGKIDILVNNAGITKDNLLIRMKDEEWQKVLNVNLTSCFILTRAAVKVMMKRRYGRIINISSVVGSTGNPGQANYCASKAGMVGMSKAIAKEVASRNITINCVAPGFIESEMTKVLPELTQQKILSSIPLNRMGSAEEVAACVAFLASLEAGYITGHTIHVNGGMGMY